MSQYPINHRMMNTQLCGYSTYSAIFQQNDKVQKVIVEETGEVELYCHSQLREKKEQAIQKNMKRHYKTYILD